MGKIREKVFLTIIFVLALVGVVYFLFFPQKVNHKNQQDDIIPMIGNMIIRSPSFQNNGLIPLKYTCDGEDINPPLEIGGVPESAKSLALIVDDPDAPMGTWVHWVVWNISPETKQIEEGMVPEGVMEGMTDFGRAGYGGPCPPSGTHRYFFKLYALDTELNLDNSATKEDVEEAMKGHILDSAVLIGLYKRK